MIDKIDEKNGVKKEEIKIEPLIENDTNNDIVNINIEKLIEIRTIARNSKMYEISDKIRDLLIRYGIEIEDKESITSWRKLD